MSSQTLEEAKDWLRNRVDEGATCPCCTQYAKVYRRKLTSVAVRFVIALYREKGRDYGHAPAIAARRMRDVAHQGGYVTLGGYWGLIQEERTARPDGGRSGYWRVTQLGEDFIFARTSIPKYVMVYNSRILCQTGEQITADIALGQHFDLAELLHETAA